ncbi:MAG: hypothetical protein ABI543_07370 [Ignavibacteria bacterium]
MPSLKEKLKKAEELRRRRDEAEESQYTAQLELQRLQKALDKQKQNFATYPVERNEQATGLKQQISEFEREIIELNRSLTKTDSISAKLREKENQIIYLKDKIEAVNGRIQSFNMITEELRQGKPLDERKLNEAESEKKELQGLLSELEDSLSKAEDEKKIYESRRENAVAENKKIISEKERVTGKTNNLKSELKELSAPVTNNDELSENKNKAERTYREKKKELSAINAGLLEVIESIYVQQHPKYVTNELNDNIPFLLFPLRIETRFITEGRVKELWIRVYPDDIAVHTHEKLLTDLEIDAGQLYWLRLLTADFATTEKESLKKDAWNMLAAIYTPQRSAWIVKENKPTNYENILTEYQGLSLVNVLKNVKPDIIDEISVKLADEQSKLRLDTAVNNDDYQDFLKLVTENKLDSILTDTLSMKAVFPVHDITKTSAWSRAPRTRILPDKFVVMLYQGENIVDEIVGRNIPDVLQLGPDPLESESSFKTENDKLLFGDSFSWASDFDKAVECGMGFKVTLNAPYDTRGYDKILVLGANISSDESESKKELEDLIDNHHYSPKGFSIIPQGSPTNNTEEDGSGYSSNDPFSSISYFVETGDPLFDPANFDDKNCDGMRLAESLGIDYAPLQYIQHSDKKDFAEASAMNKALYPATLGYYFESLLDPVLGEDSKDFTRNFFTNYVTGRGPLPAIRVGDQPYGILLTSDFTKWKWQPRSELYNNKYLGTVQNILKYLQGEWDKMSGELMYFGKPGTDASEVLMNVLGLQPGSAAYYQRIAYSSEYLQNLDDFQWDGKYFGDLISNSFKSLGIINFIEDLGYELKNANGNYKKTPQLLKLIYQHYNTRLDSANLIDNVPLSESELIRFYDEATGKNYINWLNEASTIEKLEKQDFGSAVTPTALLYMKLRHALLLQLHKESVKWFTKRMIPVEHTLKPQNFYNILPKGDLTKWEVMKAKVEIAEKDHIQKDLAIADYLLGPGIFQESDAAFLKEMKESLETLADMPTARLERCFSEHIDLCTYRLDAWQTAMFSLRLNNQRNVTVKDDNRKKGIYIGSYGWVENIKPEQRTKANINTIPKLLRPAGDIPVYEYADNGGFVHSPSLNHASASALLRSAYLSNADKTNPELFSVNLSSERVRRALFILQGLRNGQQIEVLLGYQFERGLHDRSSANPALNLNLYIYNFREAFPVKQNIIKQQGSDDTTAETIPTYSVVDGLTLGETTLAYPYGVKGLEGLNSDQVNAIEHEKDRLSDTVDAIKDLMLSESAYQLVQGNFDRTGAVLNTLKDVHVPPEIDVINTPRSSNFTFTNRVTLHFETLDAVNPASNPWPLIPMTTRAKCVAGLNKWLGTSLGDPGDIICRTSHFDDNNNELGSETVKLSDLMLQPVDLIYIIGNELDGGATEIESRIAYFYRLLKGIDDSVMVKIEFAKPEGIADKKTMAQILPLIRMLKSLVTDSRHLTAEDFEPPAKTSSKDPDNPKGYDVTDLSSRIQEAFDSLNSALTDLKEIDISATIIQIDSSGTVIVSKLAEAADELVKNNLSFSDIPFIFTNSEVNELQNVLAKIAIFGVPDAFPKLLSALEDDKKAILLQQGASVLRVVQQYITKSKEKIDLSVAEPKADLKVKLLIEAGKLIFGEQFNLMPLFYYNNETDVLASDGDRDQLLKYAKDILKMEFVSDEWIHSVAHVRKKLHKWEIARTLIEAFNSTENNSLPVQLPYRSKDSWLAVEFPEFDESSPDNKPFNITRDTISVVAHGNSAFTGGVKQSGILLDDWTEVIPAKDEITGIAFNYNQPNAVPPQALLLAVTPEVTGGWKWENLVGILNDTLHRAKTRAIEPMILDKNAPPAVSSLLPAVISEFNQYDMNVSLDYSMNIAFIYNTIATTMIALDI